MLRLRLGSGCDDGMRGSVRCAILAACDGAPVMLAAAAYTGDTSADLFQCGKSMDCVLNQAIWTEVLAPAHGL